MKVSTELPVAASDLATDLVDGQRGRPSGVMRLDLLKVVGSSPAFLASPEGVSPECAAKRSSAFQIWLWVSMAISVPMQAPRFSGLCDCYSTFRNYYRESMRVWQAPS